jgi:hypothetical protein
MFNCSIYISVKWSRRELAAQLHNLLGGVLSRFSFIENDDYELDIEENDEFDEEKQKSFPDGFLYFRYIVFIEFKNEVSGNYYQQEISRILKWLWSNGVAAVASCDYERLLLEQGGYNNRSVPWIAG